MQVDKKLLKAKFEKSMPKYDENAIVQREMAKKLTELVIEKCGRDFSHILEVGSGTGLLTRIIVQNFNSDYLTCNDIVGKSRGYIEKITSSFDFIEGNSAKIKLNRKCDLIISNAAFQWFSSISPVLEHYSYLLNNDGILAFSSFTKNNFKEIRENTGLSLNYFSAEEIKRALSEKFELLALEEVERVLNFENPLELLAHLKNTGVNSLSTGMTFAKVKDFCEKIGKNTSLTYAPIFVVAKLNKG